MALVYRSIWQDDSDDLVAVAHECFAAWVVHKYPGFVVPDEGEAIGQSLEVSVRRGSDERGWVHRSVLHEEKAGARWSTTLTALGATDEQQWLWVDLERVANDTFRRVDIAAPRLVRDLFDVGRDPRRGDVRLTHRPRAYRPDEVGELTALLGSPERDVPVVVFAHDSRMTAEEWVGRVRRTAQMLAGVVQVAMLPPESVDGLIATMGRDLAVWGGAARIYIPGLDLRDPDPWRHRVLTPRQLGTGNERPGQLLGRMLATFATSRRPPALYDSIRSLLIQPTGEPDAGALLEDAFEELGRLADEVRQLQREKAALEAENFDVIADLEVAERTNNLLSRTLQIGNDPEQAESEARMPVGAVDCSAAADQCREFLDHVVLPATVCRDLEQLDSTVESEAWGQTAWRGFRALDAYARDAGESKGGFWEWCEHSGHPWVWPATDKKLAMRESESVRKNRRFWDARRFSVAEEVDLAGELHMEAHLKIAQGGGDLAPRIYFYDDTKGQTGKVHVGFFGPHHHVPNTKS